MLQLIIGGAGTGKTHTLHQRIAQTIRQGEQAILVVPEQFSFESERALCALLGEAGALKVQVLSFTRLCHKIFYRFGMVSADFLDMKGKYMMMSLALEQVRDALTVYRGQAARASFVPVMLDMIAELKNAGASQVEVLAAAEKAPSSRVAQKLQEIGIIFEAYQALVSQSHYDPADSISKAMELSCGKGFFHETSVFIDGFAAFMAPELKLIRQMLEEGSLVTVTACCDELADTSRGMGVFSCVQETLHSLLRVAREAGAQTVSPLVLTRQWRMRSPALTHLEQNYLRPSSSFLGIQNDITIVAAGDLYDEVNYIARQIVSLACDHGYRFREIAVITRSLDGYGDVLNDVFAQYRIPLYLDRREEVESFPLANLILSALLAVQGSFDTGQLISLAKIPLLGIPEEDSFELENYCFIWEVRGRIWQLPFQNHPDGLSAVMDDNAHRRLFRIEQARETLMAPLISLKDKLRVPSGKAFAEGVYAYLEQCGALTRLEDVCPVPETGGEYVDVQSALYDHIIDILDTFFSLLGDMILTKARLVELFRLALLSCDVGKLPQTLDQVIIGSADRIRPAGVRATFVCGAVDGEFPIRFSSSGLFSDRERLQLKQSGLAVHTAKTELTALERFYTYFALTTPSEKLYISYPTRSVSGAEKKESMLVRAVCGLFDGCVIHTADQNPLIGIRDRKQVFALFCRLYLNDTPLRAVLSEYLYGGPEIERVNRFTLSVKLKNFTLERETAELLFGRSLSLSPSRLERYYGCAFAYFCDGGLRLKKRRKVEFSPLESGSLIHSVLEYLVRKYCTGEDTLPPHTVLQQEIAGIISDYLSERIQDEAAVDQRFKYLFTRLVHMLCRLILQLTAEFRQSDFEPIAFELPIMPDAETTPIYLQTPGGNRVCVQGIVDRVDLLKSVEGSYLRVVDYKSGSKAFNLTDVYYGLNMQMLIYLFTLSQNGTGALRGAFPAGVLYMPARESVLTVERDTTPEEVAGERAKGYKMNGLLIDNLAVLSHMEQGLSGMFIPAKLKRDGTLDAHSAVATLEEFGRLKRHIDGLVSHMADSLLDGQVGALPAVGLGYDPCVFCDYYSICRRAEEDPKRTLTEMTRSELLERLEEEERNATSTMDQSPE